ncbi:MAG: ACP S-malonyltransferase [Candidatus Tectomicrobia bacterium]|uniref:Malonyl CoA-acyl carrier protein transacylase n=1 Tax=Tectimicrobiota bacterium TaxID=2528274 RepID=A0A932FWQ7_UNCTE|nr:ACP S-malonyltransferase [Candidatus Tectomicrobia bacterium]
MGRELYENFGLARELFDEAREAVGDDLPSLCFQGPQEQLNLTANTQPAILLHSVVAYRLLEREGGRPRLAAGHSLGEYSALVAAGALDLFEALALVRKRGQFMQEAVAAGRGAMAALLGLDREAVEEACRRGQKVGVVQPANLNGPGQIVISGEKEAVEEAVTHARELGAKKAVFLPVSAPFHCPLMGPAEERLAVELDRAPFRDLRFPVVTNVEARPVCTADEARESLKRQVSAPVRWEESMQLLLREGIEVVVELGPGQVLSGLMKRIGRKVMALHVEDCRSLEEAREALA